MSNLAHAHRYLLVLALIAIPSGAAAQDSLRVRTGRVAAVAAPSQLTRVCYVSTSGVLVCHPIDELLRTSLAQGDPAKVQQYFAAHLQREGLPTRANTLLSCGDGIWAAAQLNTTVSGRDGDTALSACLEAFRKSLSRTRMTERLGAVGGSTAAAGRFRWGSGPGTSCSSGDPRRSAGAVPYSPEWFESESRSARKKANYAEETGDDVEGHDHIYWHNKADVYEEFARNLREEQKQKQAPSGTQRTAADPQANACAEAAAYLASLITRCERTGWRGYECAKLQSCVNPALIFPTEDGGGLKCNGAFTIQDGDRQVRSALLKACEERARYGPDGGSACKSFDRSTTTRDLSASICKNPYAIIESGCLGAGSQTPGAPYALVPPLQRDLQNVINWGCQQFGGPCFQVPGQTPAPRPGPVPRLN